MTDRATIQTSLDYDKFKSITGNRELNEPHVRNLAIAIELHDLLEYFPILINENWEIIDGQHRFEASKRLSRPIYYIQVDGLNIDDVQKINTSSRRWILKDYVQSHIERGHQDYKVLLDFSERTGFNLTISAILLAGGGYLSTSGGSSVGKMIKNGDFKVNNRSRAEDMALYLGELGHYADFDLSKNREFVNALYRVVQNDTFDFTRLMEKLEKGLRIEIQPTPRHFMFELERIYNHGAKARVDLFTGDAETADLSETPVTE